MCLNSRIYFPVLFLYILFLFRLTKNREVLSDPLFFVTIGGDQEARQNILLKEAVGEVKNVI